MIRPKEGHLKRTIYFIAITQTSLRRGLIGLLATKSHGKTGLRTGVLHFIVSVSGFSFQGATQKRRKSPGRAIKPQNIKNMGVTETLEGTKNFIKRTIIRAQ